MARKYIKLKSLKDLVEMAIWSQTPIIHYLHINDRHIYFIPYTVLGDSSILYFVEENKPIEKKFIIYNRYNGDLTFSDKVPMDAMLEILPVLEIVEQNIVDGKIFGKPRKKKEKRRK